MIDAGKLVIMPPVVPTCRAVIDLASAGASPAAVPVPTIDAGKLTAGKAVIVPFVVPTIDGGKPTAGKAVIDLASAGASPAAVPVPMIDGGKLTPGKLVIVPRSSTWQRAAVPVVSPVPPVVPTIDAGQFQGQADGGQGGHRPGKRRGLPRGRARADDRRREADGGQLGKAVIVPPRSPWCRRSTPASSKGKLTAGNSARRSSTWQGPGPPRGRARGADDRRRATR